MKKNVWSVKTKLFNNYKWEKKWKKKLQMRWDVFQHRTVTSLSPELGWTQMRESKRERKREWEREQERERERERPIVKKMTKEQTEKISLPNQRQKSETIIRHSKEHFFSFSKLSFLKRIKLFKTISLFIIFENTFIKCKKD